MSNTRRRKRHQMRLGEALEDHMHKDGMVRDGTPQHTSSGCEHHGSCAWCRGNRTFSNRRRIEK